MEVVKENKTGRTVINTKEDIFDTYVNILMFMIQNKGKSFLNKDIRTSIFGDDKANATKAMVNKCIAFYVSCGILVKVTALTDENGNDVEVVVDTNNYDESEKKFEVDFNGENIDVKPHNVKVRLYDKDIDGVDENGEYYEDYYLVNLHIPKSRDGIKNLSQTVASMFTHIPNADIYTPTIKTVLESQLFGFQTDFVAQTISKAILKQQEIKGNFNYPLDVITTIMNSKINVNVTFENSGNTIELKNTKIKRVSIKENGFDIHFDNFISQNHSDLKQIKLIENSSEENLREDIKTVMELIEKLPADEKARISEILNGVYTLLELFEF